MEHDAFQQHEFLFDYRMTDCTYMQVPRYDQERSKVKLRYLIEVKKHSFSQSILDSASSNYEPLVDDEAIDDGLDVFKRALTDRKRMNTTIEKRQISLFMINESDS